MTHNAYQTPQRITETAYRQFMEITAKYDAAPPIALQKAIPTRPYQKDIALENLSYAANGMQTVANEIACGLGKTYIAALIAKPHITAGKKVLYISPSPTAMGDYEHGNIAIFYRIFGQAVAQLNNDGLLSQVYFFTPRKFINLSRESYFQSLKADINAIFLDEVHRFPSDPESTTKVIGKIKDILSTDMRGIQIHTFTATHIRNDGLQPAGKPRPDIKYPLADAIRDGWAPDIFGLPVIINATVKKVTASGHNLRLHLAPQELRKMHADIAKNVHKIASDYPDHAHCFFVRTIEDAFTLAESLNNKFGKKTFDCLLSTTAPKKRQDIIRAVRDGSLAGYITVNVGAESVDIERLSFCHLIVRTTSMIRLAQAIGRTTRLHPEKKRSVIVDYLYQKERALKGALGLWEYAANQGSLKKADDIKAGGSLFTDIPSEPNKTMEDPSTTGKTLTYGEMEAWLLSHCRKSAKPPTLEEVAANISRFAIHTDAKEQA